MKKKRTRRASAAATPKRVWEEVMIRSVKRSRVVQATIMRWREGDVMTVKVKEVGRQARPF